MKKAIKVSCNFLDCEMTEIMNCKGHVWAEQVLLITMNDSVSGSAH